MHRTWESIPNSFLKICNFLEVPILCDAGNPFKYILGVLSPNFVDNIMVKPNEPTPNQQGPFTFKNFPISLNLSLLFENALELLNVSNDSKICLQQLKVS